MGASADLRVLCDECGADKGVGAIILSLERQFQSVMRRMVWFEEMRGILMLGYDRTLLMKRSDW